MKYKFLTFLTLLFSASAVNAAIITYQFSGEVTTILHDDAAGLFSDNFAVGDGVYGTYTLDDSILATYPRPTFARYAGNSFDVTIGSHNFYGSADHRVFNDDPVISAGTTQDVFSIINETGYTSPPIGDLVSSTFFIQFFDHSATALSSLDMVLDPPPLSSFDQQINGLRLDNMEDSNDYGALYFQLTELTRVDVPEPATLALMGLGLIGLGFAGSKNRKNKY